MLLVIRHWAASNNFSVPCELNICSRQFYVDIKIQILTTFVVLLYDKMIFRKYASSFNEDL